MRDVTERMAVSFVRDISDVGRPQAHAEPFGGSFLACGLREGDFSAKRGLRQERTRPPQQRPYLADPDGGTALETSLAPRPPDCPAETIRVGQTDSFSRLAKAAQQRNTNDGHGDSGQRKCTVRAPGAVDKTSIAGCRVVTSLVRRLAGRPTIS